MCLPQHGQGFFTPTRRVKLQPFLLGVAALELLHLTQKTPGGDELPPTLVPCCQQRRFHRSAASNVQQRQGVVIPHRHEATDLLCQVGHGSFDQRIPLRSGRWQGILSVQPIHTRQQITPNEACPNAWPLRPSHRHEDAEGPRRALMWIGGVDTIGMAPRHRAGSGPQVGNQPVAVYVVALVAALFVTRQERRRQLRELLHSSPLSRAARSRAPSSMIHHTISASVCQP